MKIYTDIDQGSGEWFKLRQGIPTASDFHRIITPAKGELSTQWRAYAYCLVAERLLNAPSDSVEGQMWMERGKELEPLAVKHYEFEQQAETVKIGFITTDDGLLGCSPDRLVLNDRRIGLEIKCPSPAKHIGYLLDGPGPDYRPQVQGQIYVAELDRADFLSYHPRMPARTIETGRDEVYIGKLAAALREFTDNLFAMLERARGLGVFQAYQEALTPAEVENAQDLGNAYREEMLYPPEGSIRR